AGHQPAAAGVAAAAPPTEPGDRLNPMNDDRDARGQELSAGDGNTHPGQVDGQHLGGVPGDGAAAGTDATGLDGQARAVGPGSGDGAFGSRTAGDGSRIVAGDAESNGGPVAGEAPPRGNAITEPQRGRRRRKRRPNMSWWVELPILLVFAL